MDMYPVAVPLNAYASIVQVHVYTYEDVQRFLYSYMTFSLTLHYQFACLSSLLPYFVYLDSSLPLVAQLVEYPPRTQCVQGGQSDCSDVYLCPLSCSCTSNFTYYPLRILVYACI